MADNHVPFTDLLENIVDNRGKTCPTSPTGLPLIATNCVRNEYLYPTYDTTRYVSQGTYRNWFRGHPLPGDLLFVTKGTPGRVCLTPDPVDFCIAQDMVAVRANPTKVYPPYLFAALRSPEIQEQIEGMHVGTMIPHFKKGDFNKLFIPLLDAGQQRFIGDSYMAFSKKIENNRRMNQTLEALARAIFKSWFVDFDPVTAKAANRQPVGMNAETAKLFPASFQSQDDGVGLPTGWKRIPVGELVEIKHGYAFAGEFFRDEPPGDILLTPGNFAIGGGFQDRKLKYYAGPVPSEFVLAEGDLLITMTDLSKTSDTLGYPAFVPAPGVSRFLHNQRLGKVIIKRGSIITRWFLYCLFCSAAYREEILGSATGTTVSHTAPDRIRAFAFALPPEELIRRFSVIAEGLFEKMKGLREQDETLVSLRDALLPRLLSGELRVKAGEKLAETA